LEGHHPDVWAPDVFSFISGVLCLDFVNTAGMHEPIADEHLVNYESLAAWSRAAGLLDEPAARRLTDRAAADPAAAARALGDALSLRLAIYRLAARGLDQAAEDDLATLNRFVAGALAHLRLGAGDEGARWEWAGEGEDPGSPLWPVALSAARLLADRERRGRVRECGGENCNWLFLDTSRNGRRRWCSMADCGNRAKAKRHYRRTRGASE
jgi:predicted RNA-binding Zn ribbon-like protein